MTDEINGTPSTTPNFQTELAAQLADLIPEAIADGKVDIEKLKELLDGDVADRSERFGLFWPGKKRALRAAQEPTTATLKPDFENSKDWDTTQNVFIEGDNLEVLKILQKHYHAKIKLIYIDPPYNTGKDFVYPDNYKEGLETYLEWTRQVNEEGKKVSTNAETEGRYHSNWLNMMYPRLKLARNLLTDDGLIAISISDKEVFHLGKLMDELFGYDSKLACAPWLSEASGGKEKTGLRNGHEYLLVYFKRNSASVSQSERSTGVLNLTDKEGAYRKGRELMKWGGTSLRSDRPNQFYGLRCPTGDNVFPFRNDGKEGHWRWGKDNEGIIKAQLDVDVFHWELRPFDEGVAVDGQTERWVPYEKIRDAKKSVGWSTWLDKFGTNADGTRELKELFGFKVFDTPKPSQLIKWFVALHEDDDGFVLDFFSGSSATADAVMQLNAEDGGTRKFIMVQLPEPTPEDSEASRSGLSSIADISRKRIDLAGEKIKHARGLGSQGLDTGFRAFKLADTNFSKWRLSSDVEEGALQQHLLGLRDSATDDATADELLTEILLKQGYSLTESVSAAEIGGLDVRLVRDRDGDVAVAAYLNEHVKPRLEQLRLLVDESPTRIIVLEDAFQGDDELKTNLFQLAKSKGIELWTA